MNLQDIKNAVMKGQSVYWQSKAYQVFAGSKNWVIECRFNGHAIALTHADGVTLNGSEQDFFAIDELTLDGNLKERGKSDDNLRIFDVDSLLLSIKGVISRVLHEGSTPTEVINAISDIEFRGLDIDPDDILSRHMKKYNEALKNKQKVTV